jgi:CheY-like chemotaxis protein
VSGKRNSRVAVIPRKPLKVLVVEDDLDGVRSTVRLLRLFGHDAAFAINGFAALEVARAFRPQVIVVDMRLPDCSGADLAQRLRRQPGLDDVRIIAISGSRDVFEDVKAAGIPEFYLKPIAPLLLEQLLAEHEGSR